MTYHSGIIGQGRRGQSAPWHFSPGTFYWPTWKKGQGRRGKRRGKKENLKGKGWKIENGRGNGMSMSRGLFFLCLSLFETTGICLGSTKIDNFHWEKSYFTRGKIGKTDFAPSEKFSSYATYFSASVHAHQCSIWAYYLYMYSHADFSVNFVIKGVLHPLPVFGLFMQFSQKLQYIDNK